MSSSVGVAASNTVDQVLLDRLTDLSGLDPTAGFPTGTRTTSDDPHGLIARASRPGFGEWLAKAARLKGCTRPIRLAGSMSTLDGNGNLVDSFSTDDLPDGVLYKPCGTRFASLCKPCSEVYRWDTYQLIKAGLVGGKGVAESIAGHPAVFATLTAPSFGPVHSRIIDRRTGMPKPCRPRRDRPVCPHGRPLSCPYSHRPGDPRVGQPLCLDCYDHDGHVVWNHHAPKLWDRTIVRLRRLVAAEVGTRLADATRLSFVKIAEMQARGAIHYHALIRFDGRDPDSPDEILPPPLHRLPDGSTMPALTAERLAALIETAARGMALDTAEHPDQEHGWSLSWGDQIDTRIVHRGLQGVELAESHVASYLAKYATKGSEAAGLVATRITTKTISVYRDDHSHVGRLVAACWRLGRYLPGLKLSEQDDRPYGRLRRWAHMLGYGGHFSSKSRRFSVTLGKLRRARIRVARAHARGMTVEQLDELDQAAAHVVIAQWRFAGAGWLTSGDAALALMAAEAARRRRPAGLSEPADAV